MPVVTINGWLQEEERMALRRWSFGKDVLELGCYEGLSTCCIAATARSVVTVDTFDGRGTPEPKDTSEVFWKNINQAERNAIVKALKGTFAEILPTIEQKFDLIFIDGSHDLESVTEDVLLCTPLLKDDGVLVFHDYCSEMPGVVKVVDTLVANGCRAVEQAGSLVMIRPNPVEVTAKPVKVAIGMPHRDGWASYGAVMAATSGASDKYTHYTFNKGMSILTQTFNELFCEALNGVEREGFTHFAMLHNDIVPSTNWLSTLIDEMEECDLDAISAVVPLKNQKGLTSTATDTPGYPWGVHRLTMREVMELPPTFTAQDVPHRQQDACLLLNSGCWVMRIDKPWVQGLHFRQQDRIVWCLATKSWAAQSISEDWDFSRQLATRGCRVAATRKVALYHQFPQYNNQTAWGDWEHDQDFLDGEKETERIKKELATCPQ